MAGYQVMPRLSPERYAALEADIIANGVQDPIKVSEAGVIVDGHHRDEIARKHDLHCPRVVVKGDDAYLRDRAYTWNGARRDLTAEERRAVAEKSLRSDPILRDSDHARRTGMDRKTVKRIRESLGIPTPDDVIREYAEKHPEKSNREVAADLGVDRNTVNSLLAEKREFPENRPPAPEPDHTPPAPGFNPGDLDEINNTEEEVRPVFQPPQEPERRPNIAPFLPPEPIDRDLERRANAKSSAPNSGQYVAGETEAGRNAKRFDALILARNILKDTRTLAGMLADTGGINGMKEHLEDIQAAIEAAAEANNGNGMDDALNNLLG